MNLKSRESFADIWPTLSPIAQEAAQVMAVGVRSAGYDELAINSFGIAAGVRELFRHRVVQIVRRDRVAAEFIRSNSRRAAEVQEHFRRTSAPEGISVEDRSLPHRVVLERGIIERGDDTKMYRLTAEAHAFTLNSFEE